MTKRSIILTLIAAALLVPSTDAAASVFKKKKKKKYRRLLRRLHSWRSPVVSLRETRLSWRWNNPVKKRWELRNPEKQNPVPLCRNHRDKIRRVRSKM